MPHAKAIAMMIGTGVSGVMTALQAVGGEDIAHTLSHSIIAGVFAGGGAWALLRERVAMNAKKIREHEALDTQRFQELGDLLREHSRDVGRKFEDLQRDIGELVGEAKARRQKFSDK